MDSSNILVYYGYIQDEDVEVDYDNGDDDDSHWALELGCVFLV